MGCSFFMQKEGEYMSMNTSILLKKEIRVSKSNWKVKVNESDIPELLGLLIDSFEDFLESKGISSEMMQNSDIDSAADNDTENTAIIYGQDYDSLANSIAAILGITRP